MSNSRRILRLLRGHEAARIRFTFPSAGNAGNITVNRTSFHTVAKAIEDGQISVQFVQNFAEANNDVVATYNGTTNILTTRPLIHREEQGLVLHECTHAAFDLTHTVISGLDEEAAAFLVYALYFRMSGLVRHRWNLSPHPEAGAVADGLLHQYAVGTHGVPAVDASAWAILRIAVLANPAYGRDRAQFMGGSYMHDG
jgi:hypothetical protein